MLLHSSLADSAQLAAALAPFASAERAVLGAAVSAIGAASARESENDVLAELTLAANGIGDAGASTRPPVSESARESGAAVKAQTAESLRRNRRTSH
jgi:hypothetical protein